MRMIISLFISSKSLVAIHKPTFAVRWNCWEKGKGHASHIVKSIISD